MKKTKVVFIALFKYSEKSFCLPISYRESYKKLFAYIRESDFWDFAIYENSLIADVKALFKIINDEIDRAQQNQQQVIFFI
jgi:hypothetical protein